MDYWRQESRWWRDFGLWGWLGSDGHVRAIIGLGSVLEDEFLSAFGRRWPTTFKTIEVQDVRSEIYFALWPGINFDTEPHHSRYQRVRMCIEPSERVSSARALTEEPCGPDPEDHPMAVVL